MTKFLFYFIFMAQKIGIKTWKPFCFPHGPELRRSCAGAAPLKPAAAHQDGRNSGAEPGAPDPGYDVN